MKYRDAILQAIDKCYWVNGYYENDDNQKEIDKAKELVHLFFDEIEDYKDVYSYFAFDNCLNIEQSIKLQGKSDMCNDLLELEIEE